MRTLTSLLLLLLLPSLCDAQLFGRKRRYDSCPDGYCTPSTPNHPSIKPEPDVVPSPIDFTDIPADCRVTNISGNCVWATAEAVFRACGYEAVVGLRERAVREGWHGAWISNLTSLLKDAGIGYKESQNGSLDIFDYAREHNVPVYVQIRVNRPEDHAVAVVGMDEARTTVRILDPNSPGHIQTWTMDKFKSRWGGRAACPLFNKRKNKGKPAPAPDNTTPTVPPKVISGEPCNCKNHDAELKAITDKLTALENKPTTNPAPDPAVINTLNTIAQKVENLSVTMKQNNDGVMASLQSLDKRVTKLENASPTLSRIEQTKTP